VIESGRARVVPVEVGHRNASEAEIIKGLDAGAKVILHPANVLRQGTRIAIRKA
jgi:HlyD family secretion protein